MNDVTLHNGYVAKVIGRSPQHRPYIWIGLKSLDGNQHYRTAIDGRQMNALIRRWKKAHEKKR